MGSRIFNINKRTLIADFSWLPALEKIFCSKFKIKKQVSIALVSPEEIRELNRVYRNKNKVTDVLSFELDSQEILGEVIICLEQAKKQAEEKQKSIKSELQLLLVHGILHLLGYDHERGEKEFLEQTSMEQEILDKLN
ncbi:rRNA maturation RNase YbeY [Candidatus Parcubacteria bacterium]|nr:MAG: rRNA maturation RNase YbeY [Candidatus Parcubacteria bacterium]